MMMHDAEIVEINVQDVTTVERRARKSPRNHGSTSPGSAMPPEPRRLETDLASASSPVQYDLPRPGRGKGGYGMQPSRPAAQGSYSP